LIRGLELSNLPPDLKEGDRGRRLNQSRANDLVNHDYAMMPP